MGLAGFPVPELYNVDFAQVDAAAKAIAENADMVLGAKVRMSENVIAKHGLEPLRRAILAGDAAALTIVPGVGKKVAQRVVIDLRDRLGAEPELVSSGPLADVREALLSLGVTPQEATDALSGVDVDEREVDELLRDALQRVGR